MKRGCPWRRLPDFGDPKDNWTISRLVGHLPRQRERDGDDIALFQLLLGRLGRIDKQSRFHIKPLHNRMPVILPERDYSRWLDVDSSQVPIDMLRPYEADQMTAWEIDKRIGNVRNDSPELLEEQSTPPKEPSLFDDAPL
jgi:hypothetical protein